MGIAVVYLSVNTILFHIIILLGNVPYYSTIEL